MKQYIMVSKKEEKIEYTSSLFLIQTLLQFKSGILVNVCSAEPVNKAITFASESIVGSDVRFAIDLVLL